MLAGQSTFRRGERATGYRPLCLFFSGALLALCLCFSASTTHAVVEVFSFSDPLLEKRYQHFVHVLRCPKCQNQNLEGSDSPIAADLRRELYAQLEAGKTDEEIISFMIARYGDFVLYKPPLQQNTRLLWFLPVFMLLAGLGLIFLRVRSVPSGEDEAAGLELSEIEAEKLEVLTRMKSDD